MKSGERWHCVKPVCRCEVLVEESSCEAEANPRCACGSPMKKNYKPPVFRYLDFLSLYQDERFAPLLREK